MKFSKFFLASFLSLTSIAVLSCSSTKKAPDSSSNSDQKTGQAQSVDTNTPSVHMHTIYFDFNKYVIRPDQVAMAKEIATSLKASKDIKVQIQGNTDDRGSVEYNMALGSKRADALKKFLQTQGVPASNMSTVSYGKEHPAVQGNDEGSWAKNRRDDVVELK